MLAEMFAEKMGKLEQQADNLSLIEQTLRKRLEPLRKSWAAYTIALAESGPDDGTNIPPAEQEQNRNELAKIEAAFGVLPKTHREKAEALKKLLERIQKLEEMLLPENVRQN